MITTAVKRFYTFFIFALLFSSSSIAVANEPNQSSRNLIFNYLKQGEINLHAGWFDAHQGKSQHVSIQDLIGDHFSVRKNWDDNVLVGLGFYLPWKDFFCMQWQYGLDAYYLADTTVKGTITQENLYTNLSYRYNITNYPIYIALKGIYHYNEQYQITFDAGIGPNVISTSSYKESTLNADTLPDHLFSGNNRVALTVNLGVGLRLQPWAKLLPVEIGYRFFYLGQSRLSTANTTVTDHLYTGQSYAHAIIATIAL